MRAFALRITIGNDAMQTDEDVASAIEKVAGKVRRGYLAGVITDDNGNNVGMFTYLQDSGE